MGRKLSDAKQQIDLMIDTEQKLTERLQSIGSALQLLTDLDCLANAAQKLSDQTQRDDFLKRINAAIQAFVASDDQAVLTRQIKQIRADLIKVTSTLGGSMEALLTSAAPHG